jgi:uncharacterized damage-inducible protein DinB
MAIRDSLLPEFDMEMASTRKTLERVPDAKLGWKPHPKSGAMGWLASHVADIGGWAVMTITQDSVDIEPNGVPMQPPPLPKSTKEIVEKFDKNVQQARAALSNVSDADLMKPWSLLKNGKALMTMPKVACLRGFIMNHMIHHRAQLGVYLRLNDVPVPSIYGPSADESAGF